PGAERSPCPVLRPHAASATGPEPSLLSAEIRRASCLLRQQLVHHPGHLPPPCRLLLQRLQPGPRDGIVPGFPVALSFSPGTFDPPVLFQPDKSRIDRALIDFE